jgi:hypothetical protein
VRPFLPGKVPPAALSIALLVTLPGATADIRPRPDWAAGARQPAALFGFSVSTAGDVDGDGFDDVIVGACCYATPEHNAGRAFVFHGGTNGLRRTPRWSTEGHREFGYFGSSVGTAGDVNGDGFADVIVGAWGADLAAVFHGSPTGLSRTPDWVARGQEAYFGDSVSTAGDVNGDGYDDVIVGAPHQGPNFIGGAFVYFGSPDALSTQPDWSVLGPGGIDYFGSAVSTAGDVNGDGFDDVIVGAHEDDAGEGNEGRAFLYQGSPSGPSNTPDWVRAGDVGFSHFGYSVGPAGDVNADGYADVTVGALYYPNGGRAYAFYGSPSGLRQVPDWIANGSQPAEELGHSVRTAGDLNGDGYDDLIVGAPWYTGPEADEGRILVFHGSDTGLHLTPAWTAESNEAGLLYCTCFGWSVGTAGDVNGDGRADVAVGAPYYTLRDQEEGIAVVYQGRP